MAILIIDDEPGLRRSLCAHFEDRDHGCLDAGNGFEGLEVLRANKESVEAIVVDLNMPGMDGYTFISHAFEEAPDIPVIVLSGIGVVEDALRAIRLGAWDFITKPLHNLEILDHCLEKVLERAQLRHENRIYQNNLEQLVHDRTKELEDTRRQVMQRLSRAAEFKDNETGRHVIRVGQISKLLGHAMGLAESRCELLGECSPLHDVGKIGIPDNVLLKPGRLDPAEWEIMRQHCVFGCEILGPLDSKEEAHAICTNPSLVWASEGNELLNLARILALCHHERWDGTGYPFGLSAEEIPLEARIVSVVDVYDALRSNRPYKNAVDEEQALEILRQGAGSQFDPKVIEALFGCRKMIAGIWHKWRD